MWRQAYFLTVGQELLHSPSGNKQENKYREKKKYARKYTFYSVFPTHFLYIMHNRVRGKQIHLSVILSLILLLQFQRIRERQREREQERGVIQSMAEKETERRLRMEVEERGEVHSNNRKEEV